MKYLKWQDVYTIDTRLNINTTTCKICGKEIRVADSDIHVNDHGITLRNVTPKGTSYGFFQKVRVMR